MTDVASLPGILRDRAKASEVRGHHHPQWSEGVRFAANQIEAALSSPAPILAWTDGRTAWLTHEGMALGPCTVALVNADSARSPAPSVSPAYDRELIARMLDDPDAYSVHAVEEQTRLLREADNAEAANIRTVDRSPAVAGDGLPNAEEGDFDCPKAAASRTCACGFCAALRTSSAPQGEWPEQFRCDEAAKNIDACRKTTPPPAPAANFDEWARNPYTVALHKSITEDYMQKQDATATEQVEAANALGDWHEPALVTAEQPQGEMVGVVSAVMLEQLREDALAVQHYGDERMGGEFPDPDKFSERLFVLREALSAMLSAAPSRPVVDAYTGWLRMTDEARKLQARHLASHHGDVYHAMQSLASKYGAPDNRPMFAALAGKDGAK